MVVLINPNLVVQRSDPFTTGIVYMPIGLAYVAAALRQSGDPPRVIDAFAERPLQARHEGGVTYLQLGARLGLDKSAAMRRAKVAMSRGYLRNLETRRGQPAKLIGAEPLPADVIILPTVETLTGCTVARAQRGETP